MTRAIDRLACFDIIRFLALFLVIAYHVAYRLEKKYDYCWWMDYLQLGNLGVSFFIVLSGCGLAISFQKNKYDTDEIIVQGKGKNRKSVIAKIFPFDFYIKRFLSILPFYWCSYLITTLILLFLFDYIKLDINNIWRIIFTLFGLDGFLNDKVKTFYLIGEWFTGFILLLYLIAPLIIYGVKHKPYTTVFICFIISYFSTIYSSIFDSCIVWNSRPLWNPTARLFEFSIGVCITYYILNNFNLFKIVSFMCLMFFLCYISYFSNIFYSFSFETNVIYALLFICLTYVLNRINSLLYFRFVFFLSKYSFLAFLYHHQIIKNLINVFSVEQLYFYNYLLYLLGTVCISYLLAYISYYPSLLIKNYLLSKICNQNVF